MLLFDTQILQKTANSIVFTSNRVYAPGRVGIVAYDKYSDEDSLLGLASPDPDTEDYVLWRFQSAASIIGAKEKTQIVTYPDISNSLSGTYFCINSLTTNYYVWYNTGASVDPAPGATPIQVNIATNATDAAIATATTAALILAGFQVSVVGNLITVVVVGYGDTSNAGDFNTGFVFSTAVEGGVAFPTFTTTNDVLYPIMRPQIPSYNVFRNLQFNVITEYEWKIVQSVLKKVDMVRRRYPNLGQRQLGLGIAGGYEKKFSIEEILDFLYQTVVEINLQGPSTKFWFEFNDARGSFVSANNPYMASLGVPFELYPLLVDGTVIKALLSRQLFEIDTNFNISDQGISITYDKDSKLSSVISGLIAGYEKQKESAKMQYLPHSGSAVGTFFGYAGHNYFNTVASMLTENGVLALKSLVPYYSGNYIG